MKYTRSLLAVLLSLVMIALCMPAASALDGTDGNIKWEYDSTTKTLTLSRRSGSTSGTMKDYSGGHYPAWWNLRDYIQAVVIGDGVTNVSSYAFWLHSELQSVTINAGVTDIDGYAFIHCRQITTKQKKCKGARIVPALFLRLFTIFSCKKDRFMLI